jgi:hypothetical protein
MTEISVRRCGSGPYAVPEAHESFTSGIIRRVAPSPQTPAEEPAHDVLAAEAFAMPAPDPGLRRGPVVLPDDPTGIQEAHDVLAAEEFAMPAPKGAPGASGPSRAQARRRFAIGGAAAALAGLVTLRRRRG